LHSLRSSKEKFHNWLNAESAAMGREKPVSSLVHFQGYLNPLHPDIRDCKVVSTIPFALDKRVSKKKLTGKSFVDHK
jgi:hypothetical protein